MAGDHYATLGLSEDATLQDIKRAFRQIARECHPDVAGDDAKADARFKAAREAYEVLSDEEARARYDRRNARRAEGPRGSFFRAFYEHMGGMESDAPIPPDGGGEPGRTRRSSRRANPANDLDLEDLFNDFGFGGGPRVRPGGGRPEGPSTPPERGEDVHIELEVPSRVAERGGSVTAVYHRLQRADSWRPGSPDAGVVRIQDIADVRIIPGTPEGTVLRERGLGDAGRNGGPYGDLVARVRVVRGAEPPPAEAPSEGATNTDGVLSVDISVPEALLGGRIEVDTPTGRVRVTVPPCTSSGARLRLKERGRLLADGTRQDLFVELRIVAPSSLDDESRRLVEAFARLNPGSPRDH